MKITKYAVAVGLLLTSAAALAANAGCCGNALCCIKMLLCC
jgi:hypothetical protein